MPSSAALSIVDPRGGSDERDDYPTRRRCDNKIQHTDRKKSADKVPLDWGAAGDFGFLTLIHVRGGPDLYRSPRLGGASLYLNRDSALFLFFMLVFWLSDTDRVGACH